MASADDPDGIEINVRFQGSIAVVTVAGEVDMGTAPALTEQADAVLADRPPALIIDLTGVEFLASAGLETLLHAHHAAKDHTVVVVVADGPATSRPIAVTGINSTIALYRTLDEALAQLSG